MNITMTRTIKFRGKRTNNGEWVYGDLFNSHAEHHSPNTSIATNEFHPIGYGSKTFYEVDPSTVGQFTGLLDKNKNEIYEGDIVANWQGGWNVVVYKAPTFEATVSENQSSSYSIEWWEQVLITGNIHDQTPTNDKQ